MNLSVVVPAFNDFSELEETLRSLSEELQPDDEVLVVDSSTDAIRVPSLLKALPLRCFSQCYWVPPAGVYAAQNYGIVRARAPWVQVLGAGDRLLPGGRALIAEQLERRPEVKIHIFGQVTGESNHPVNRLFATPAGVWPHQSVIISRTVHEEFGLFDENLRLVSDQLFFARVRHQVPWRIHSDLLTYYDLSGVSSRVTIAQSKELFLKWRALGRGVLPSVLRAFVFPRIRLVLEAFLGKRRAAYLKRHFNSEAYGRL